MVNIVPLTDNGTRVYPVLQKKRSHIGNTMNSNQDRLELLIRLTNLGLYMKLACFLTKLLHLVCY
jgi:hypothetical protein